MSERLVLVRPIAVTRDWLFDAARRLDGEGQHGAAIVIAQAAVELGVETAIDVVLSANEVHGGLTDWITARLNSWSPANRRIQDLWESLTDDKLTQADGWSDYKAGTDARHDFVHRAKPPTHEQAERFIAAAEKVLAHVLDVTQRVADANPPDWPGFVRGGPSRQ